MSLLRRTLTVFIVGPSVLYIIQTWYGVVLSVWFLHLIAMMEWTGLKRHLKLCLLDPLIHGQRQRNRDSQKFREALLLEKKQQVEKNDDEEASNNNNSPSSSSSLRKRKHSTSAAARKSSSTPSKQKQIKNDNHQTVVSSSATSSPSLGLFGESSDEKLVVLDGLPPWTDKEFPTPIAPVNLFIFLKCFACSLIIPLAAFNSEHFVLMLSLYFFFWVLLTLLDSDRHEMKQDVARQKLQGLCNSSSNTSNTNNNNNQPENYKTRSQARFDEANKPLPTSDEFALRELEIVSCYPNVETFINFSIEYFGFVWISNMAFAPMLLSLGDQGRAALTISLFANWMNDAGALAIGKTVKAIFGEHATHPLYPRISPSKSLEGAVFGILANAAAAALGAYWIPAVRLNIHNQDAAPKYYFVIGLILGILGVIGDLLQSLFKRVARIKDTGTVFPGHGGVLDRIDGLVTTFPVVYWLVWGLQKGYFDPLLDPKQ